ncbi:MAG: outer membrane lipoprotein LolB [Halioglobus sp.]|nr:outer membrane lipoprotein LolB [Halioglobus sp.]
MRSTILWSALLLWVLTGCSTPISRAPTPLDWLQHRARLQQLTHWQASGKLALRSAERAETAALNWRQDGPQTRLRLSGPMGLNSATIYSDGRQMEVQQGDELHVWDVSTPGALASSTGWDLPLPALPYWLKGLPWPQSPVQRLEMDPVLALPRTLLQDDWEIHYEHYRQFEDLALPTRLRIRRGDTSVRLIISNWQVLPG